MSAIPILLPNTCHDATSADPPPVYRRAYLEDFFENADDCNSQKNKYKYNKYNSYNDTISKNQQEFGHRKRIKP
jgi:hypothetical protein